MHWHSKRIGTCEADSPDGESFACVLSAEEEQILYSVQDDKIS